jgi:anti-sigma regulatory factor (Ser/Thr protein kinase)
MSDFNESYIRRSHWRIPPESEVVIDLEHCRFFTPIGLTFLAGYIKKLAESGKHIELFLNSEVLNYLERIGFLEHIDGTFEKVLTIFPERPDIYKTPLSNQLVEFQIIGFWELDSVDEIATHLAQITAENADSNTPYHYFENIYSELLDNAFIHAGTTYAQVVAQTYPQTLKISISDSGVGIPQKLREKYTFANDFDGIELATDKSTTTQERDYGTGLTMMREYLTDPADRLFIISNQGCVTFYRNGGIQKHHNFCSEISGTYIEIVLKRHSKHRQPEHSETDDLPF